MKKSWIKSRGQTTEIRGWMEKAKTCCPFAHLLWKSKCLLMPKILSYRNVLHLFGMLSPSQFQQCPLCWGYNPKKHQQPPKSTTILKVLFNNNRWRWCSHKSLYIYDILMLWILKNILVINLNTQISFLYEEIHY